MRIRWWFAFTAGNTPVTGVMGIACKRVHLPWGTWEVLPALQPLWTGETTEKSTPDHVGLVSVWENKQVVAFGLFLYRICCLLSKWVLLWALQLLKPTVFVLWLTMSSEGGLFIGWQVWKILLSPVWILLGLAVFELTLQPFLCPEFMGSPLLLIVIFSWSLK